MIFLGMSLTCSVGFADNSLLVCHGGPFGSQAYVPAIKGPVISNEFDYSRYTEEKDGFQIIYSGPVLNRIKAVEITIRYQPDKTRPAIEATAIQSVRLSVNGTTVECSNSLE